MSPTIVASPLKPESSMNTSVSAIAMPRWTSIHSAGFRGTPAASSRTASPESKSRFCVTRPASSTAERATWLWPSAPEVATACVVSGRAVSE